MKTFEKWSLAAVGVATGLMVVLKFTASPAAAASRRTTTTTRPRITYNPNDGALRTDPAVLFNTESDVPTAPSRAVIEEVARWLRNHPGAGLVVEGHTDSDGAASYNQALSERRAQSVASMLEAAGTGGARLDPVGFGEEMPIATNDTAEGKRKNRRIDFTVFTVG